MVKEPTMLHTTLARLLQPPDQVKDKVQVEVGICHLWGVHGGAACCDMWGGGEGRYQRQLTSPKHVLSPS